MKLSHRYLVDMFGIISYGDIMDIDILATVVDYLNSCGFNAAAEHDNPGNLDYIISDVCVVSPPLNWWQRILGYEQRRFIVYIDEDVLVVSYRTGQHEVRLPEPAYSPEIRINLNDPHSITLLPEVLKKLIRDVGHIQPWFMSSFKIGGFRKCVEFNSHVKSCICPCCRWPIWPIVHWPNDMIIGPYIVFKLGKRRAYIKFWFLRKGYARGRFHYG